MRFIASLSLSLSCLVACAPPMDSDAVSPAPQAPPPHVITLTAEAPVYTGTNIELSVTLPPQAPDGITIWFVVSAGELGPGICPPRFHGECLGFDGVVHMLTTGQSASQTASASLPSTTLSAFGDHLIVQAAYLGQQVTVLSNAVSVPLYHDGDGDGFWSDVDCDDDSAWFYPGSLDCPVADCVEAQELGLLPAPNFVWIDVDGVQRNVRCDPSVTPPVGLLRGEDAGLSPAEILSACPSGSSPFQILSADHIEAAASFTDYQQAGGHYLLNSFAGPAGAGCPTLAVESGWLDELGIWTDDGLDLGAWGLDVSVNCNLDGVVDPIPFLAGVGPRSTAPGDALHGEQESAEQWPVLCVVDP